MAATYNLDDAARLALVKQLAEAMDVRLDTAEAAIALGLTGVSVNGTALAVANKMVDIAITTGETNGTFKANGSEVAIAGLAALAYKANVSQTDLDEALSAVITAKADADTVYTKAQVDGIVSSVYKPAGSVAFASLPAAESASLGKVYNVTDAFTTTDGFVEGAGQTHPAGTNVVVVETGEDTYGYDVLSGFVDLSDYAKSADVVAKEDGKSLMLDTDKAKLDTIAEGATKVEGNADVTNGTILVNGVATTVVKFADDAAGQAMLDEVFGATA